MNETISYIEEHVVGDISWQPEVRRAVARTMLALLKIRKVEDYEVKSLLLLSQLEKRAIHLRGTNVTSLMETVKASFKCKDLSDDEADEVERILENLVPKQEETLERYMSRELELETEESFNPDRQTTDDGKSAMAMLAMNNSNNLENFQLSPDEDIPDGRISEIVTAYFESQGYILDDKGVGHTFTKEEERLMVNVSNFGYMIMVSVMPV